MMKEPLEMWGTINEPINASLSRFYLKESQKKRWKDNECYNIIEWRHCAMSSLVNWRIPHTTVTSKLSATQWSLCVQMIVIASPGFTRCAGMFLLPGNKRMDGWTARWVCVLLASFINRSQPGVLITQGPFQQLPMGYVKRWESSSTHSKKST